MRTIALLISILTGSLLNAFAQDSTILVKGKVIQHPALGFSDFIIVNLASGRGEFGMGDGTFQIRIKPKEDIRISCLGFKTVTVSFRDSIYKPVYTVLVEMKQLTIQFDKPVIIRPQPTYESIEEAREKIGTTQYEPLISNPLDAIFSPITALYQAFSKKEKEKRIYAELVTQKQVEDALKDLTRYHINSGLFDLTEDELELFISTCPLPQEFVKNASLYEISTALQNCYNKYKDKRKY